MGKLSPEKHAYQLTCPELWLGLWASPIGPGRCEQHDPDPTGMPRLVPSIIVPIGQPETDHRPLWLISRDKYRVNTEMAEIDTVDGGDGHEYALGNYRYTACSRDTS